MGKGCNLITIRFPVSVQNGLKRGDGLKFLLIASVLIYPLAINAQLFTPCDVNGLGYETDEISFLICGGSFDH
jgi:hypothetical protein